MPSDMRDELVGLAENALDAVECLHGVEHGVPFDCLGCQAFAVIDSIPPFSFKNEKGEWVRSEVVSAATVSELAEHWQECPLPPDAGCAPCHRYAGLLRLVPLYTEVDRAE